MWKKVLAVICIPVALLFTVSAVQVAVSSADWSTDGTLAYRLSFYAGLIIAQLIAGVVLFFWWRWIIRTLRRPRGSAPHQLGCRARADAQVFPECLWVSGPLARRD